jgi:cyclic-di-AMP phosphodiesterase PgpH
MAEKTRSGFKDSFKLKLVLAFITVILIVLMFPRGESIESEVTEGSIWIHDDLIAPFSFPILKDPEIYKRELQAAADNVYPVFTKNPNRQTSSLDSLEKYNQFLLITIDSAITGGFEQNINPTFLSTSSFNIFKNIRQQERDLTAGGRLTLSSMFNVGRNILGSIYVNGVLNIPPGINIKDSVAIRTGNIDRIEPIDKFLTEAAAKEQVRSLTNNLNYSQEIENAIIEYIEHFIYPDLIYDAAATEEEIKQAQDIVSKSIGIVNENERIIAKHDRVSRDAKLKIDSYKEAKGERIGSEGILLQSIGKFLHIAFLMTLLAIYIYLFRKKIYHDNLKILLIALLFIFISFVTFLIGQINVGAPLHFLIFIPAASMLLTIIFDSRVGFYTTVILALVAGALRGNDYTFAVMNIFAGALSVYTVRDIKNRSQIFRSFLFILLGYTISVIAFGLERFATPQTILVELAFAGSNALISPVLTYGLLIFFERLFLITTDLTLLELSNFDRPLLKDLARKAPGTFNHSMTMGTLAESAAERIGANPLLARVGAYYHDIGKTITPQNFVENQINNRNIHEDLSPEESVSFIKQHVVEGVELARKNKIPEEIIDFIPAHHGTMVMTFFYEKAKELYGEEKVDIDDYKYPGPKPQTKETAILMLADGCESAVRSISDPNPVKVENIIDNIIESRVESGQLDESPLTFRDIKNIKEAFISILLGQHHRRIRYPKQEEIEKGTDEKKDKKE